MKTKILLVYAFAVLASACAAPSSPQAVQTELPAAPLETSPTSEAIPALPMTTYTDDSAGFSLDYPADWFIDASAAANADEAFAYSVGIATWDLRNPPTPSGKGQNAIPDGGTKIDIAVMKQAMTLEEAVAQQSQNEAGSPILARKDVLLANGLPAVILDVEGFAGLTRTLITVLNGNVIYVSGYGNLERFEEIAITLRAR